MRLGGLGDGQHLVNGRLHAAVGHAGPDVAHQPGENLRLDLGLAAAQRAA